ncbi:unnamed protein product [Hapterophycus canaliculatus]
MATSTKYRCAIDIGVINIAFCVIEFTEACDGTFTFELVHMERATIGDAKETIHVLGKKLLSFYSTNDALQQKKLDYVFIEQQLSRAVKNIVLAYVTIAYFETKCLGKDNTTIVFASPKSKFKAVRYAFHEDVLDSINFNCHGRELKKLSVRIAQVVFKRFGVKVRLDSLIRYKTKLDDVSDVFLQSFVFFLEKFPSKSRGHQRRLSLFVGIEENGQREDADEKT